MLASSALMMGVAYALSEVECSVVCMEMARELHSTCPRPDPRFRAMFHNVDDDSNVPSDWIPDQGCDRCPPKGTPSLLRSLTLSHARQTKFQFHNSAPEMVHVYWHDGQGQEHFKATISPNGFYGVGTWEGHAFRVWNTDHSSVLMDYTVGRLPLSYPQNEKRGCRLKIQTKRQNGRRRTEDGRGRTWTRSESDNDQGPSTWLTGTMSAKTKMTTSQTAVWKQEDFKGVDWRQARFVGFVNRANKDLDLFFMDGNEEVEVGKIPSAGVAYQITYHTHKFRAKISNSSLTVSEVKITDIEIPDCGHRRRCNCGAVAASEPMAIKNQQGTLNVTDSEALDLLGLTGASTSLFDGTSSQSLNRPGLNKRHNAAQ